MSLIYGVGEKTVPDIGNNKYNYSETARTSEASVLGIFFYF
jgi:hypothetical protein